jgi:hypothetical protein
LNPAELRPLNIGEILDVSIKIYRSNFATLVKAVAIVVAPVQVLSALVQASTGDGSTGFTFEATDTPEGAPFDASEFWAALAGSLVVGVLGWVASQLATGASLKAVASAYMGERPDWLASLRFALGRLESLVWLAFLTGLLLFIGLLLCIVPGVYLWGAWAVAIPVLLLEPPRGMGALKRSMTLVQGRWWPTVLAVFLGVLLTGIVQAVLAAILGGAVVVSGGDNDALSLVVGAVTGTVGGVIATPFTAAIATIVYFDLRVRKEGLDLQLMAQQIGEPPPPEPPPPEPPPEPPSAEDD